MGIKKCPFIHPGTKKISVHSNGILNHVYKVAVFQRNKHLQTKAEDCGLTEKLGHAGQLEALRRYNSAQRSKFQNNNCALQEGDLHMDLFGVVCNSSEYCCLCFFPCSLGGCGDDQTQFCDHQFPCGAQGLFPRIIRNTGLLTMTTSHQWLVTTAFGI